MEDHLAIGECLRRLHISERWTAARPFHVAVWVVALVTFFVCRRRGEATVTILAASAEKYHVLRSTVYVLPRRPLIEL